MKALIWRMDFDEQQWPRLYVWRFVYFVSTSEKYSYEQIRVIVTLLVMVANGQDFLPCRYSVIRQPGAVAE